MIPMLVGRLVPSPSRQLTVATIRNAFVERKVGFPQRDIIPYYSFVELYCKQKKRFCIDNKLYGS